MAQLTIYLPKIGESTQEATITFWCKNENEFVAKDDILLEISTDKVNSELPSEFEGILQKILAKENEMVKVGAPIALMEVSDEVFAKYNQTEKVAETKITEKEVEKKSQIADFKEFKSQFLSPIVRKLIAENNISFDELAEISTKSQRISKKDIENYLKSKQNILENTFAENKLKLAIESNDLVQILSPFRKKLSETLQTSYQTIPHVTTFSEINVTQLVAKREELKNEFQLTYNQKVTYTHFIMYEVLQTLKNFPQLNAWLNVDEYILKGNINLGFAAALPDGNLIVPNIKNAETLNFNELIEKVNETAQRAKSNKLQTQDIENTTFTVSNTGIFGSLMGTPIIVRPQVAILALGEIHNGIDLDENDKVIRVKKMYASLSYDHRVIDGALASKFLNELKTKIQTII